MALALDLLEVGVVGTHRLASDSDVRYAQFVHCEQFSCDSAATVPSLWFRDTARNGRAQASLRKP